MPGEELFLLKRVSSCKFALQDNYPHTAEMPLKCLITEVRNVGLASYGYVLAFLPDCVLLLL
jgi:hypothetical protein